MGYYRLDHASYGKTTHSKGAAAKNIAYNAREEAVKAAKEITSHAETIIGYNAREDVTNAVRSHIIPIDPKEAQTWFSEQERSDRKNARMLDRLILSFPRSFSLQQCIETAVDFCQTVTGNKVPWHIGVHYEDDQREQQDWNPHCHIGIRDRHVQTGRRCLYTSAGSRERAELAEKGIKAWSTKAFREEWENTLNRAFERYNIPDRVDCRSYRDRGIDKVPGVHLGPKANALKRKGIQPKTKQAKKTKVRIDRSIFDNGSRAQHNEQLQKDSPKPQKDIHPWLARLREQQTETRKAMYAEQKRDRDALRAVHNKEIAEHKKWAKTLYTAARKAALAETKASMEDRWKAARRIKKREERNAAMATLKLHQKVLYANMNAKHVMQARKTKDDAYAKMRESQIKARADLREQHAAEYNALNRQHLAEQLGKQEEIRRAHAVSGFRRGGMAQQQAAAINLLRQYSRKAPPVQAPELIRAYYRISHIEGGKREALRRSLDAGRQSNLIAAMPRSRHPSQARGAMQPVQDSNQRAREALLTGQHITNGERLNASPGLRARFEARDKKQTIESYWYYAAQHTASKGRGGGGGRSR